MTVRDSSGAVVQFLFGEDGLDPTMASLLGECWRDRETYVRVCVRERKKERRRMWKRVLTDGGKYVCVLVRMRVHHPLRPPLSCQFTITPHSHPLILTHPPLSLPCSLPLISTPGGKPNQMQFLARNHQAVSHKYSMHEGLFTHGVNYELAVEHHDRMKQARKMMAKGVAYFTYQLFLHRLWYPHLICDLIIICQS